MKHALFGAIVGASITVMMGLLALPFLDLSTLINVIAALGALATGVSAAVAYRLYKSSLEDVSRERRRLASKEYLSESVLLLSRAYALFAGQSDEIPSNDRLLWLSVSRMLVRYQNMRERISEEDHLVIVDEHEEYWRLQFYVLLGAYKAELNLDYFIPSGDKYGGDVVSRKAVAIIFDFAKWREGDADPLDAINDKQLLALGAIPLDFHEVKNFLMQYEAYWQEVEGLKAQLPLPS